MLPGKVAIMVRRAWLDYAKRERPLRRDSAAAAAFAAQGPLPFFACRDPHDPAADGIVGE